MTPNGLPPDIPFEPTPAAAQAAKQSVDNTLAECNAYTQSLLGRIRQSITSCLSECNAVGENCHSCISGRVTLALNDAEAIKNKCLTKIVNAIRDNLGEAYWYAERFIGPPPTMEQLQQLASGGSIEPPQLNIVQPLPVAGDGGAGGGIPVVQPGISPPPLPIPPNFIGPPIHITPGDCGLPGGYCPGPEPEPFPSPAPPPVIGPPPSGEPGPCPSPMPICPPPIINIPPCPPMPAPPGPMPAPPPGGMPPGGIPPGFKMCPDGEIYSEGYPCPEPPPPEPPPPEIQPPPIVIIPPSPPPQPPPPPCPELVQPVCVGEQPGVWDLFFPEWNSHNCPDFSAWEKQSQIYKNVSSEQLRHIIRAGLGLENADGMQLMPRWIDAAVSALPNEIPIGFTPPGLQTGTGITLKTIPINIRNIAANILWRSEDILMATLPSVFYANLPRFESCDPAPAVIPWIMRFLVGIAEEWLGEGVSELRETLGYQVDYWCPAELINAADTHTLYAKGIIDEDTWRCWIRANNLMDKPQELVAKSLQFTLTPEQIITAFARGLIDRNTLSALFTNARVKDNNTRTILEHLQDELPQLQEILRGMRIDIHDDNIAEKYGLDEGADAALVGPYAAWLGATQATQDNIQDTYRSQWRVPGIQELALMLFRLRNDSLNVDNQDLELDQDDIDYVYSANGVSEYWRDRLLAIQRPAVGIRYLHLLIRYAGWIDDQVIDSLKDEGWSDDNANQIAKALREAEDDRVFKELSVLSPHDVGRSYATGYLSRSEANRAIVSLGYTTQQAEITLSQADTLRTLEQRKEIVKVVEQQFKSGLIDRVAAVTLLVESGIPQDQSQILADQWEQAKQKSGKPPKEFAAAELCTLWEQGLITSDEYYNRLIGVGWSAQDAIRIVTSCGIKVSAKQAKASGAGKKQKPPIERKLSVAELCTLNTQGLINDDKYYADMLALGFSGADATALIQSCKDKAAGKRSKASAAASSNGTLP